jgi:23S rRNA (guanine745-N1)-methyltransferase
MPAPPLTPLAAAVLQVGQPERVLAIDCGDGEGALFLAREFPRASIRGIDRSPEAVRAATSRVGLDPEGRIAFKLGGSRVIPFPDDHFDLLTALDSHPGPTELARVLRPGGHLILASTSNPNPASRLLRWRLERSAFELQHSEQSGNGSFLIARL